MAQCLIILFSTQYYSLSYYLIQNCAVLFNPRTDVIILCSYKNKTILRECA